MIRRRLATALFGATMILSAVIPAPSVFAADRKSPQLPEAARAQKLAKPAHATDGVRPTVLAESLRTASGRQQVVIRLKERPAGALNGAAKQKAQAGKVKTQQAAFVGRAKNASASFKVLGQTSVALNAVMAQVDAKVLAKLSRDPAVASIRPVVDYQLDLSETVPYIGGTALHDLGLTGKGITVAVLDSGIDYTHAALGGPGTALAYENAYGKKMKDQKNQKINDAYKGQKLFPTAKVIGGYDFVGEFWTGGAGSPPLTQDPDPIPCGPGAIAEVCDGSHGTHVADIIAGKLGVAPDAKLLAIKVCSQITTSCSGVAMIQGMDFALDPNGDGSTADRADAINVSIGGPYTPVPDDDMTLAAETATAAGMVVVGSAGNSGDKPYVVGGVSTAPAAISVAQTAVPSSTGFAMLLSTNGGAAQPREAVFQSWSKPLTAADAVTNAPIQYGDGAGHNLDGCAPFAAGSLTGKVVLVDRGTCNFSAKIADIAAGGGKIGVIGLITPGDPFDGSLGVCDGGLCHNIPGYMVSQSTANAMKLASALVTFDPANSIPLVGQMVGSSSRGPSNLLNAIKPEIGAPGASVSAVAGSGTGTAPFGGTSGAAPMVTGSAALLRSAFPTRSPLEIKAVLINTAETNILNRPTQFGGTIAPITRIGGGEVRVDRAYRSAIAAWVDGTESATLGFGFQDVAKSLQQTQTVRVRNYSNQSRTVAISRTFRFANDETNGAVTVTPSASSITVPAHGDATFRVTVSVDATKLRAWAFDSGANGANPTALTTFEYDGYVWLDDQSTAADNGSPAHLPWQVLPRKAAEVTASSNQLDADGSITLANTNGQAGTIEAYSLVATSPNDPASSGLGDNLSDADFRAIGVGTFAVPPDFCSDDASFVYAIDVTTWERQVVADAPALFEFDFDLDRDGTADYAVYNRDLLDLATLGDGRNGVWVQNLETGDETAFFLTDHNTNSANTVLYFCAEQMGLTLADAGREVDVEAFAVDLYESGLVRDELSLDLVFGGERYLGIVGAGGFGGGPIGAGASVPLSVLDFGADGTNPTETGLLLRVVNGTAETEAIEVTVNP
jgi:subtilisin family serine protease